MLKIGNEDEVLKRRRKRLIEEIGNEKKKWWGKENDLRKNGRRIKKGGGDEIEILRIRIINDGKKEIGGIINREWRKERVEEKIIGIEEIDKILRSEGIEKEKVERKSREKERKERGSWVKKVEIENIGRKMWMDKMIDGKRRMRLSKRKESRIDKIEEINKRGRKKRSMKRSGNNEVKEGNGNGMKIFKKERIKGERKLRKLSMNKVEKEDIIEEGEMKLDEEGVRLKEWKDIGREDEKIRKGEKEEIEVEVEDGMEEEKKRKRGVEIRMKGEIEGIERNGSSEDIDGRENLISEWRNEVEEIIVKRVKRIIRVEIR